MYEILVILVQLLCLRILFISIIYDSFENKDYDCLIKNEYKITPLYLLTGFLFFALVLRKNIDSNITLYSISLASGIIVALIFYKVHLMAFKRMKKNKTTLYLGKYVIIQDIIEMNDKSLCCYNASIDLGHKRTTVKVISKGNLSYHTGNIALIIETDENNIYIE